MELAEEIHGLLLVMENRELRVQMMWDPLPMSSAMSARPAGKHLLEGLAKTVVESGQQVRTVRVIGHGEGSRTRAESVRARLIGLGVAGDLIVIPRQGFYVPGPGGRTTGRNLHRRVEIEVELGWSTE